MRVLFVCTGNVCRSPMAEFLFRSWLPADAEVQVTSAGTSALVGHAIDYGSASVLGQLGIDASAHRARQFEPQHALDADLVLTAELAHRDQVLTEAPGALRRTFTMREFARLVPHVSADSPLEFIALAAKERGMFGSSSADDLDVPDPYRGGVNRAREVSEYVLAAVRATLDAFGLGESANRP